MSRSTRTVWLGLGSNIGDRSAQIRQAVEALSRVIHEIKLSSLYESAAQDFTDQPDFLNAALRGESALSADALLERMHVIEQDGGRLRDRPKGPRTIDIDILLYGEEIIRHMRPDGSTLTIPHQSMTRRLFVLMPLLELDADLRDPRDGIAFQRKASHLSDQGVKLYQG